MKKGGELLTHSVSVSRVQPGSLFPPTDVFQNSSPLALHNSTIGLAPAAAIW